jgi:filamentous hemagglutinin family protein
MSYPGNPTEDHAHTGSGCISAGGTTNTVITNPNGIIAETNALGCIPDANFGENTIVSGTPSGIRRAQGLRGSLRR